MLKTFIFMSFSRIIRSSRERGEETISESGLRLKSVLSLTAIPQ